MGWSDGFWDTILGTTGSEGSEDGSREEESSPLAHSGPNKYSTGEVLNDEDTPSQDELPDPNTFDILMLTTFRNGQVHELREVNSRIVAYIDPENADEDNEEEVKAMLRAGKEETGGFAPENSAPVVGAMQNGADEYISALEDFYTNKVPTRFVNMIQDAALLRFTEANQDLSRSDVREWKGQMTKHGNEALQVASLCSSGFFDHEGLFQKKYRERVLKGSHTLDEYRDEFIQVVTRYLFVVFVRSDPENAYGDITDLEPHKRAYDDAIHKARHIDESPWEFDAIQVRGTGEETHPIVEETADYFLENHDELDYRLDREERDLVFRFDPDTL